LTSYPFLAGGVITKQDDIDKNFKVDAFARKPKSEWLSKKRQMQGAQLSRNEAYLGTPQ
jgi:hypothetical protein